MPVDPLLKEVVALFVVESGERIATIAECVLALERAAARDDLARHWSRLARELHTLKGTAATAALVDLAAVAHEMETIIAPLMKSGAPMPAVLADAFLQMGDAWIARARAYADGTDDDAPLSPAARAALTAASTATAKAEAPTTTLPAAAEEDAAEEDDAGSWRVSSDDVLSFGRDVERVRELRLRLDERVKDVDAALAAISRALPKEQQIAVRAALQGVRRGLVGDVEEATEVVEALEDGVKAICTLPVRTLLDPLHRTVRDLCRASGKQASLAVVGGDVAVDRRLLEGLRGPLIQLVRNAVDHGVEAPEARRAKGKHESATISVRIELQGNLLFIEVADDGAGLRTEDIRSSAVKAGVVGAEEAAGLDAAAVHQLIFRAGLSTRDTVSETSGRGVGLDLVLSEVRALRGHVDVATVDGHGTRFLLHVPMELGGSAVLIVRCGDHLLGVPMAVVEAVVAVKAAALRVNRRATVIEHRDQFLPVLDFGALLGVRAAAAVEPGAPLLVFASGGKRCALLVDDIVGDRELVVRPLPREFEALLAYQGVAVMAKGDLLLVLRPDWLAAHDGEDRAPAAPPTGRALVAGNRVLVVDDSLTARALHRTILEAGGYTVHLASSVGAAEEQLRRASYDVVVCDFHFAAGERDGLGLLRAVRADPRSRGAAFIIVSTTNDVAARERGRALGADAWLTKEECAMGRLLDQVAAVVKAPGRGIAR